MDRMEFKQLAEKRPILLDGATGTELMRRGLPPGAAPEKWGLDNPSVIQDIQRSYFEAGSDIVVTCTFGANRVKLADHGLAHAVRDMNARLAEISRAATPTGRWLFGDMSPTGHLAEPFGDLPFEEAVDIFREQARALADGGVDGFVIETMLDIQEARAAVLAAREAAPHLPIIVGMTFEPNGRTLGGTPPEVVVATLQSLGADAVGANCSRGPGEMLPLLDEMVPYSRGPLLMMPNAGMPCSHGGGQQYSLTPGPFAEAVLRGVAMGARVVGGCCGTTAEHIRAVRAGLDEMERGARPGHAWTEPAGMSRAVATSARKSLDFEPVEGMAPRLIVIGERINPTGKKKFQAELLSGDFGLVLEFAEQQAAAGADMLDVNLGLGGLDEKAALCQAVSMLAPATDLPLALDSVNPEAMEAALRLYPGRALVNSVSGEADRLERILPLVAKYGAMLIVLPVGDSHVPATVTERAAALRAILEAADRLGVRRRDIIVDGLAMTVSADPAAAGTALDFVAVCADEGLKTILGLSNVSFGMPERKWLNAVFLAMAAGRGLNAVIANPSSDLIMQVKAAADALGRRAGGVAAYIERFAPAAEAAKSAAGCSKTAAAAGDHAAAPPSPASMAAKAVLKGNIKKAGALARAAVESGVRAGVLVSEFLAPAIIEAGALFERNVYYLPQLMLAGEAMRLALEAIESDLAEEKGGSGGEAKGRIIMATVAGDVHDIGKNLVSLMLRNHGFDVLDLGKDVSPEAIVASALESNPDVIGLSALMTTTLASMRETISACRAAGVAAPFMVGGAAVTERFAGEAGADGYAPDAVSAIKLTASLMRKGTAVKDR